MSGGAIAIKGFDYQATAILDQLFDHFDRHGSSARAHPEEVDDLDLIWTEGGRDRHRHVQIKKPRETVQGQLKASPWHLTQVADELLPKTLEQLQGNDRAQVWILGDQVASDVRRLLDAGRQVSSLEPQLYWSAIHRMARMGSIDLAPLSSRAALLRWRPQVPAGGGADQTRKQLIADFGRALMDRAAPADVVRLYDDRVVWIDERLPDVLERIQVLAAYGAEEEVARRVRERLERDYGLAPVVIEHSLFRNLRGFINDAAKPPGATFDRVVFETQLRSAWPQMSLATDPPSTKADGVLRRDLTDVLTKQWSGTVVETIGISGSGKTFLAAQAAAQSRVYDPHRLTIYVRVRADVAFRDVLAGAAFYLLSCGAPELFALAVESKPSDEAIIARLAEIYAGLSRPVLLLLDLVDGGCDGQFGRDLGVFVRSLAPGACRLVVFSQESAFSGMSPVEKDSAGIRRLDMRGFNFEEFVTLVGRHHPDADLLNPANLLTAVEGQICNLVKSEWNSLLGGAQCGLTLTGFNLGFGGLGGGLSCPKLSFGGGGPPIGSVSTGTGSGIGSGSGLYIQGNGLSPTGYPLPNVPPGSL